MFFLPPIANREVGGKTLLASMNRTGILLVIEQKQFIIINMQR